MSTIEVVPAGRLPRSQRGASRASLRRAACAVGLLLGSILGRAALAQPAVLVEAGDVWMYAKGTVAPPADWNQPGFNDSDWLEGATGIGYADGDDATVLGDMQNGYMAFFARRQFTVASLASVTRLVLTVDYDDGFVAYLNGTEVARANLGTAGTAVAFDAVSDAEHEAGVPESFDIGTAALVQGTNVLAVELHNVNLGSSDASMIPRLVANASVAPGGLACVLNAGAVTLTWTNPSATYTSIRVERNGTGIATLAGDAVTYTDAAFDGLDNAYRVVAIEGGAEYPSAVCNVGCTQATVTCTLALVDGKTQATVTWTGAPAGLAGIDILREGAAHATLDGAATQHVDPDVESEQAEDDTAYTVVFRRNDGRTCTAATGDVSLCPNGLQVAAVGTSVRLTWEHVVKLWDHYEISRDGVVVDTAVPGSASTWTDPDVVLSPGDSHDYVLHPVAAAGDVGTTCDLTVQLSYAPVLGRYDPPAGGWDYVLDFESGAQPQYNANAGEKGNLDGQWIRSTNRDLWDGSAPFEVGPAPGGPAPGGLDVVDRPGLGECGANAKVLRLLDPGNAGAAIGTTFPTPFDAPNNSRIVIGFDLGSPATNLLKTGVTFAARLRASPDAPAYMNPQAASGDGYATYNGTGHVGIYHRTAAGTDNVSAAFSIVSGAGGGDLEFSANGATDVDGIGTLDFVSVWMTVRENATTLDTYDVSIYLNGSLVPYDEVSGAGIALQAATVDFGTDVANYLAIAANNTNDDCMVEVDYVAWKAGVFAPTVTTCGGGGDGSFRRGDANDDGTVNITDGIYVLNFLFLGGETPLCMDSADANDDGGVNITDGILILNFLFLGGEDPPSPGPTDCGPDVGADDMEPCLSTQC